MELENEEDEVEIEFSLRESIVQNLKDKNLLRYGSLIEEKNIEKIMGVKKEESSYPEWAFAKLQLRNVLHSCGYFVTERGQRGALYILLPHEMPLANDRKNKSMFRALKLRQRALHMIDPSTLSSEHCKKLEFEILRNASLELEMASKIKERCR